jgi:hypothetical protein
MGLPYFLHGNAPHFSVSSSREVMLVTPSAVSPDVVALLLDENDLNGGELQNAVITALSAAGCDPWRDMEAEIYTYGKTKLLIARPSAPLSSRVSGAFPRLRRSVG